MVCKIGKIYKTATLPYANLEGSERLVAINSIEVNTCTVNIVGRSIIRRDSLVSPVLPCVHISNTVYGNICLSCAGSLEVECGISAEVIGKRKLNVRLNALGIKAILTAADPKSALSIGRIGGENACRYSRKNFLRSSGCDREHGSGLCNINRGSYFLEENVIKVKRVGIFIVEGDVTCGSHIVNVLVNGVRIVKAGCTCIVTGLRGRSRHITGIYGNVILKNGKALVLCLEVKQTLIESITVKDLIINSKLKGDGNPFTGSGIEGVFGTLVVIGRGCEVVSATGEYAYDTAGLVVYTEGNAESSTVVGLGKGRALNTVRGSEVGNAAHVFTDDIVIKVNVSCHGNHVLILDTVIISAVSILSLGRNNSLGNSVEGNEG